MLRIFSFIISSIFLSPVLGLAAKSDHAVYPQGFETTGEGPAIEVESNLDFCKGEAPQEPEALIFETEIVKDFGFKLGKPEWKTLGDYGVWEYPIQMPEGTSALTLKTKYACQADGWKKIEEHLDGKIYSRVKPDRWNCYSAPAEDFVPFFIDFDLRRIANVPRLGMDYTVGEMARETKMLALDSPFNRTDESKFPRPLIYTFAGPSEFWVNRRCSETSIHKYGMTSFSFETKQEVIFENDKRMKGAVYSRADDFSRNVSNVSGGSEETRRVTETLESPKQGLFRFTESLTNVIHSPTSTSRSYEFGLSQGFKVRNMYQHRSLTSDGQPKQNIRIDNKRVMFVQKRDGSWETMFVSANVEDVEAFLEDARRIMREDRDSDPSTLPVYKKTNSLRR